MQKTLTRVWDIIIAALTAALILYSTMFLARKAVDSQVYQQSRIVSMLVQQDTLDISDMLSDTRGVGMIVKFAGALTSAYINFELIPVNEAPTFMAVFESMPDDVSVSGFDYRRKDLIITGSAKTAAGYESFIKALRERDHFASVSGSGYDATDGSVRFEIVCASNSPDAYLDFS